MIGTLRTFTNMVYSIGKERFGTKKGKLGIEQKDQTTNRRERRIREYRQELKELNKQFKRANEWEQRRIQDRSAGRTPPFEIFGVLFCKF